MGLVDQFGSAVGQAAGQRVAEQVFASDDEMDDAILPPRARIRIAKDRATDVAAWKWPIVGTVAAIAFVGAYVLRRKYG